MGIPVVIHCLTVQEYHQLSEAEILRPDERVELWDRHLVSVNHPNLTLIVTVFLSHNCRCSLLQLFR
jgi:hypothetical protein